LIIYIAGTVFVLERKADEDKFEKIYEKYSRLMYSKAYEILQDHYLTEDAVSEAFIRILKNLRKLDDNVPSARTASFVVTVVKNVALTMVEKKNTVEIVSFEESYDVQDDNNCEMQIVAGLNAEEILNIVDSLNEDLKQVFLFYYAYEMSLKEIGDCLGITANLAAVRLHRARKKLSERILNEGRA
jgi:RNA polymerase sigma-70 factor (ECF subfamily)